MKRKSGLTLIELMVVVALMGLIIVAAARLLVPGLNFFKRAQSRHAANTDSRKCLETLESVLKNGRANSVRIWTDAGAPPNSHIQFLSVDNSTYSITWSPNPPNSLHVIKQFASGGVPVDSVIATNVTGLMFTLDFRDPGVVNVSYQIDVPLDNAGQDSSVYTIYQPPVTMHMSAAQSTQ